VHNRVKIQLSPQLLQQLFVFTDIIPVDLYNASAVEDDVATRDCVTANHSPLH